MDIFDLSAKITLDSSQYEKGLESSKKGIENVGDKIKTGLANAAKIGAAAVGAASAAVVKLVKDSVEAYAEYEQLVGGVETLFGTGGDMIEAYAKKVGKSIDEVADEWNKKQEAQHIVLKNASEAYKTAGLSANQYMETVTSFSASLIQSLEGDTTKAAEYSNRAVIDMADNANKMGTSIEMIQNAYSGFAKENYTMLDNLKLGYGGTKTEMARLIQDASKMTDVQKKLGITVDASSMSFGNVVNAISVMQESLGIAGTTAREAEQTISGSLNMVKASWQNMLVAISEVGYGEDLQETFKQLSDSILTFANNVIPVATQALQNIAPLIQDVSKIIIDELPGLVETILPPLLSAATDIVNGVVQALPSLLKVLIEQVPSVIDSIVNTAIEMLPTIIELGLELIKGLSSGLIESLPTLGPAVVQVIMEMVNTLTKPENLSMLLSAALELVLALVEGLTNSLPQLIDGVFVLIENIVNFLVEPDNLEMIIQSAIKIVLAIVSGLIKAIPQLLEGVGQLIANIISKIFNSKEDIQKSGQGIVSNIIEGIKSFFAKIKEKGKEIITNVKKGIDQLNPLQWGKDLIQNFINGIKSKFNDLKNTVNSAAKVVKDRLGFSEPSEGPLSNFHTYAPDMMNLFIKGIKDNTPKLQAQIEKSFDFDQFTSLGTSALDSFSSLGNSLITSGFDFAKSLSSNITSYATEKQKNKDLKDTLTSVLSNVGIYLDSGELVGYLTPKINQSLGMTVSLQARGI